ncbi:MAG: pyruvate formate-lyase-activating protein [Syntrophomonadaceae bacterium]
MLGRVHSIDTFSTLDGPGIRVVIFMQGCHLRCRYCQNPDTWDYDAPTARVYTPEEVMAVVKRCQPYLAPSGGGLTFSGGEPLLQHGFVREVFERCQLHNIHTAVDTSLYVTERSVVDTLPYTQLVLADIKQMDPEKSIGLVGTGNRRNLENLRLIDANGVEIWIRYVVVPGHTDHRDDLAAMAQFIGELVHVTRVDLLPYHALGKHKWQLLGLNYELDQVQPPHPQYLQQLKQFLEEYSGKNVYIPS